MYLSRIQQKASEFESFMSLLIPQPISHISRPRRKKEKISFLTYPLEAQLLRSSPLFSRHSTR